MTTTLVEDRVKKDNPSAEEGDSVGETGDGV